MSNSEFKREERYLVVKIRRLRGMQESILRRLFKDNDIPLQECVVVEPDGPNYEDTWKAIEQVANGEYQSPYEQVEQLQARNAELERERDCLAAKLGRIIAEIEHIISDSAGVAGYHMNGDMTYWSEFDIESIIESAPQQLLAEQHSDDKAVHALACEMKEKLAVARSKGRSGWDDKNQCSAESLATMLIEHLSKGNTGNYLDVANFCMMLHQRGESPEILAKELANKYAELVRRALEGFADSFNGSDSEWVTYAAFRSAAYQYAQREYGVKDGE